MILQKIGIMGGTFDPFHNSHLQVALAALQECALDHIDFVPAAIPPHKARGAAASFSDRVNMIGGVCAAYDYFSCNDIEGKLQTPSYSVDTLNNLQKGVYKSSQLYFIIGVDAFLEIDLWRSYQEVLERVHFIVCKRLGYDDATLHGFCSRLGYENFGSYWQNNENSRKIHLLDTVPEPISSSRLKKILRQGGKIDQFVPVQVLEYIQTNNLYKPTSTVC